MRVAILVSGNGTLFEHLTRRAQSGNLPVTVVLMISSNPSARALERAKRMGIPSVVVSPTHFSGEAEFAAKLIEVLRASQAELICLAGFMKRVPAEVVAAFRNRILNIHPALLPAFGGAGMYGRRVHEAVVRSGVRISGATVHLVDEEYDRGPIVLQRAVFVSPDDTAEQLEIRVHTIEYDLYCEALRLVAEHRVEVEGGRVRILPKETS